VDHGEAYGNLGEEAMILNALARIETFLRPRAIYITHAAGKPLPTGNNPRIRDTPSPYQALRNATKRLHRAFQKWARTPRLRRLLPREDDVFYWRLAVFLDRWFPAGLDLRNQPEVREFLRALDDCRVYYHVGMSGLNEFWEPGLVYKRWVLRQARRRVDLVVLSSQGLGPVNRPSARREMKGLLEHADVVSLRDKTYGTRLLAELGVSRVHSKVVFDEAFSFPAASPKTAEAWLAQSGLSPADDFVAFHYREMDYTQVPTDPVAHLGEILKAARTETHFKIVFIPMSYGEHSSVDSVLGQKLAGHLGNPDWFCVLPECRDASILKAVIGRARFGMGLSYHTAVFSLTQGHPALVLYTGGYYGLKSDELVSFYGPPSVALDLNKTTADQIRNALRAITTNYETHCQHIAAVNDGMRRSNDWTLDEIRRRLKVGSASVGRKPSRPRETRAAS
jgi:polysaccharide pyruvyl transferase WcaK-like protein